MFVRDTVRSENPSGPPSILTPLAAAGLSQASRCYNSHHSSDMIRTTISISDSIADGIRRRAPGMALSEFARLAMAERLERLEREELAKEMREGYAASSIKGTDTDGWEALDLEGWD